MIVRAVVVGVLVAVGCGSSPPPATRAAPIAAPTAPEPATKPPQPPPQDNVATRVDKLYADLEAFDAKVTATVDAVAQAQTDADRTAISARLDELQKEATALKERAAADRNKGENDRLDSVVRSLEEIEPRLTKAMADVRDAQDQADRATAMARLNELKRQQAEMREREKAARDAAAKAKGKKGKKGKKVPKECIDNPLARGCD